MIGKEIIKKMIFFSTGTSMELMQQSMEHREMLHKLLHRRQH